MANDVFLGYTGTEPHADLETVWDAIGAPSGRDVADLAAYLANNAVFNVKDYGATGDGVSDDSVPILLARDAAEAAGDGARLFFPRGRYVSSEIAVATDGIEVVGEAPGVRLLARADSQTILRIAASYCSVRNLWLDENSKTGVDALVLAPADESDHATRVDQNYNRVKNVHIEGCANGIRMRCGPGTVAGDSGCWYNTIEDTDIRGAIRGLWLQDCVTNAGGGATAGSLVNRNHFKNLRVGQAGTNVGIHIEAGGTNVFVGTSLEGVVTGSTPLATPTGLYIAATAANGGNNDDNHFYGTQNEANTRDVYCDDPYTVFVGLNSVGGAKVAGAFFAAGQSIGVLLNAAYLKQRLPGPLEFDPSTNDWTAGVPLRPMQGVGKYGGTTALIANGATADLTITDPRHPMLLSVAHTANLTLPALWLICGDGVSTIAIGSVKDMTSTSFSVAAINATTLRITNSSGSTCRFSWGVCPFGPAL